MGEYVVANGEFDTIRTFSLSTCVAVTAHCPLKKAAGMVHVVLPSPFHERDKRERPGYFALTGIPLLIETICRQYGCRRDELQIRMFGGLETDAKLDIFKVGKENIKTARYALARLGLRIKSSDLGGDRSRTLEMEVKTGLVRVYHQPLGPGIQRR